MSNKNKQNKKQGPASEPERKIGYGDKKLEGPDRPST